ncbi:site-specific integrase [Catenulispora rubra]|uniref:site-specific integrase n=1 Tax=Catenulispora rubra TaxID=280293 RepID=UPI0018922B3E|nr:site-specific integrase [Catenulispora rubra]
MAAPKKPFHPELVAWLAANAQMRRDSADRHGLKASTANSRAIWIRAVQNELGIDDPRSITWDDYDRFTLAKSDAGQPLRGASYDNLRRAFASWIPYVQDELMAPARATDGPKLCPLLLEWKKHLRRVGSLTSFRGAEVPKTCGEAAAQRKARDVQRCMELAGKTNPKKITQADVLDFLDVVEEVRQISHSAYDDKLRSVRQFAQWAKITDPTAGVERRGKADGFGEMPMQAVASEFEITSLILAAQDDANADDPELRGLGAMIEIILVAMADCALRVSEAIQLDGSPDKLRTYVDRDGYDVFEVCVAWAKGSDGTPVWKRVNPELYERLRRHGCPLTPPSWRKRPNGGNISGYWHIRAWAASKGVPRFGTHSFRRAAAVRRFREPGANLLDVADLLGHADPHTTWTYLAPMRGSQTGRPGSYYSQLTARHAVKVSMP